MIYDKYPIDVLYEILKPISNEISIYKEIFIEDENSSQSYVLIRTQISDTIDLLADGKEQFRSADCDVIVSTKGADVSSTGSHILILKKIRELLKTNYIMFQEFNLGYDTTLNRVQHTFSMEVKYFG